MIYSAVVHNMRQEFLQVPTLLIFVVSLSAHAQSVHNLANVSACDSDVYCKGELLAAVQNSRKFKDSKTFVDMKLKQSPDIVLSAFANLTNRTTDSVKTFVDEYFEGPGTEFEIWNPTDWTDSPKFLHKIKDAKLKKWATELNGLWKVLVRKIKEDVKTNQDQYSLIYLPHPFAVPGGRFREVYYWDSYWVVNGLLLSEMYDTVKGMINNFLSLVETYDLVPNGGRIYYTRRSQPPLLIPIVDEYIKVTNDTDYLRSIIQTLEKEYMFWVNNRTVDVTKDGETHKLARYAVEIGQPRPESYREDEDTASGAADPTTLYSNIASAAESGWDFSTRWFASGNLSLSSIRTRDIIPVDLNAIICWNEKILSNFYRVIGDNVKSEEYRQKSEIRQLAIEKVLWNETRGIWQDFDMVHQQSIDEFYASCIAPFWTGCYGGNTTESKTETDRKVLKYLEAEGVLDYPGGVPTSKINSSQQWDFPNGWPPIQQMFIWGLDSSSLPAMKTYASTLAQRWTLTNWRPWIARGHMYEKYDVTVEGLPGHGGEYEVQIGFGWTNAVVMQILDKYGDVLTSDSDPLTSTPTPSGTSRAHAFLITAVTIALAALMFL